MRLFLLVSVVLSLGVFSLAADGCGNSDKSAGGVVTSSSTAAGLPRDVILTSRADDVFSSIGGPGSDYPDNLVSASELYSRLQDPVRREKLYLLDTRPRNEWEEQGHIEGAHWMKMQEVAEPENLATLPRDKQIVCLSPTGHTAVQVMTVLRWLGYDAVALEFGYGAWIKASGNQVITGDVQNGLEKRYPVTFESSVAAPIPQQPDSPLLPPADNQFEVLDESARKLLAEDIYEKEYPFNHIFADDLFRRLNDPDLRESIFVLDIRPLDVWEKDGRIDHSLQAHIDWRVLGRAPYLASLPKDKLIVVVGSSGQTAGQVTPVLRMLGYNAVTLRSGMTAWTETPDSQPALSTMLNAGYPVEK